MKPHVLLPVLCALLMLISCTSKNPPSAGSYMFNGYTYSAALAKGNCCPPSLLALNSTDYTNNISVYFYFNTYPPAAGTYAIETDTNNTGPGKIGLQVCQGVTGSDAYKFLPLPDSTITYATVSVSGNKVSVVVPPMRISGFYYLYPTSGIDTLAFSANITQTQ